MRLYAAFLHSPIALDDPTHVIVTRSFRSMVDPLLCSSSVPPPSPSVTKLFISYNVFIRKKTREANTKIELAQTYHFFLSTRFSRTIHIENSLEIILIMTGLNLDEFHEEKIKNEK